MEIIKAMTALEKMLYFGGLAMFIASLCLGWKWCAPVLFWFVMAYPVARVWCG